MSSTRAFAFAALVCLATPRPAQACSVCIAHMLGAALHGIGAQTLPKGSLVVGTTYLGLSKSNAGEEPGTREFETYREASVGLAYGLSDRIMLGMAVPYVWKSIEADGVTDKAAGLGDATIGVTFQQAPKVDAPLLTAFTVAVKLPTGSDSRRDGEGNLLEQHLQPGTGSTDLSLGVSFTKETGGFGSPLLYGGLSARLNGRNTRSYQFGNVLFYNLGYSHPFGEKGNASVELLGRFAAKDHTEDGSLDENSGGHLMYLGLSVTTPIAKSVTLGASWQVPILQRLFGDQTERGVFSVTLAGRF